MFTVLNEERQEYTIPLLDFHTHIGKVAIETTKGPSQRVNRPQDILDLYEKLKFDLYDRITSQPDKYYITLPSIADFIRPLYPLVKNQLYANITSKGWIADQIVSFPFNDIFHLQTKPKFIKSNDYVRHSVNKFDLIFRFIPFCRVDATDQQASEEVLRSAKLGAKGLKLHPLSQNWIDKIISSNTKTVLQTAGKLSLPIIFDVPNKGVAQDITEIAKQSRESVEYPINVVLGHNGFDYTSKEVFDCINQNGMFTEISGLRGSDVHVFFKNVMQVENWFDKILFGTDSNYFTVLQASDFISYLLSYDFLDLLKSKSDQEVNPFVIISKILALNALKILPLNYPNRTELELSLTNKNLNGQYEISCGNFINSFKKIIQNKSSIITTSLIQLENVVSQAIYFQNEKEINRFILSSSTKDNKVICMEKLENIEEKSELNPELVLSYQIKNTSVSINMEKIQKISTLEETL